MNEQAQQYWIKFYPELSQDDPGIIGSLLARTEVYARMLAMIFALFDKKIVIEISHLRASLRWIAYVKESAWYLFGNITEQIKEHDVDEVGKKILTTLKEKGIMTRTEINKIFNGHKTAKQINEALERLLNQTPASISQIQERTSGRSKVTYKAK